MTEKRGEFRYLKLYKELQARIMDGSYPIGSQMPTEYLLQEQYKVSRDTLRKALAKLEQEGFISRRAGKGTFVQSNRADYPLSKLEGFSEQMRRRGLTPTSKVLSLVLLNKQQSEPCVWSQLQLEPEDVVYQLTRVRFANGNPMAYEISYVPEKLFPNFHLYLTQAASLMEVYTKVYHMKVFSGDLKLEAVLPTEEIQQHLGISSNAPLLKLTCTYFLDDGTPIDFVYSYHNGEKYDFSAKMYR